MAESSSASGTAVARSTEPEKVNIITFLHVRCLACRGDHSDCKTCGGTGAVAPAEQSARPVLL